MKKACTRLLISSAVARKTKNWYLPQPVPAPIVVVKRKIST